jgi:hypothetical protein
MQIMSGVMFSPPPVPHRYSDLDEMSDGEFGTYVQVLIMQEEY